MLVELCDMIVYQGEVFEPFNKMLQLVILSSSLKLGAHNLKEVTKSKLRVSHGEVKDGYSLLPERGHEK